MRYMAGAEGANMRGMRYAGRDYGVRHSREEENSVGHERLKYGTSKRYEIYGRGRRCKHEGDEVCGS